MSRATELVGDGDLDVVLGPLHEDTALDLFLMAGVCVFHDVLVSSRMGGTTPFHIPFVRSLWQCKASEKSKSPPSPSPNRQTGNGKCVKYARHDKHVC